MHSQPMPSLSRRRDLSLRYTLDYIKTTLRSICCDYCDICLGSDLIKLCERLTSKNDGEVMTVTVSLLQDVTGCKTSVVSIVNYNLLFD